MTTVDREADRHLHGVAVQAKAKWDCSWGRRYDRPVLMAAQFPILVQFHLSENMNPLRTHIVLKSIKR